MIELMLLSRGNALRTFSRRWMACLLIIAVLPFSGCGSKSNRPRTAQVRGKVIYDGKPLELGSLLFVPKGGGPPAQGNIESDGTYRLGTFSETDGAVLGEFQVIISAWTQPMDGSGLPEDAVRGNAGPVSLIPEVYGDITRSGLSAVVRDEENTIDFTLEKKTPAKNSPARKASNSLKVGLRG